MIKRGIFKVIGRDQGLQKYIFVLAASKVSHFELRDKFEQLILT